MIRLRLVYGLLVISTISASPASQRRPHGTACRLSKADSSSAASTASPTFASSSAYSHPQLSQPSLSNSAATYTSSAAASSASAETVSAYGASAGKMGISWAIGEGSVAPVKAFFASGSKVSWWWNWNKNCGTKLFPGDASQPDIPGEFVPMLFDFSFLDNDYPLQEGYSQVQGWNEPDMKGMGAADAAGKWKTVVQKIRAAKPGVKLWSPAPAYDQDWMETFLEAICPSGVKGCDFAPDYLNMRIYNTDVEDFKTQLTAWHTRFGMDIIVGEFACDVLGGGKKGAITAESVSRFMSDIVPWLEQTPWIYRYSWFGGGTKPASLNDVDQHNALMDTSGQLTALGKQYVRGGV